MNKTKNSNIDSMFSTVLKNKPCLYIWRVEETQLMPVSKDFFGIFFKGDVYLIYSCLETMTKSISQHIHLWIGAESSSEDQGIGAFKMIELDDYLNNNPIQHRECQNYETERFLSYFKSQGGIKYMNGGWSKGDHYYEREFQNRIYRVKGKRLVRLNELKCLDWTSLNRNDSFLIDFNTVIFIWNGRNTNKMDKLQLLNKVKLLRNDKNVNIVIIEDGEEKDLQKDEIKLFETFFPLKEKIKKLKNDPYTGFMDDVKLERDIAVCLKLYKCSYGQDNEDDTIKIKIIEQKPAPIYREDLNSEDSFIIDNGKSGIYVWSGRKCNPKERQEAMRNALGFLQAKGYDELVQNAIKVTCINEGFEPVEFRALFSRWSESKYSVNSHNKTLQVKFDASVLHANPQLASELLMIDDGSGSKKIWVINNLDIYQLDETKNGQFHSSNCYVIEYKYYVNGIDKLLVFYWIGRKSSIESQNVAALKALELEKNIQDSHIVRVFQEKETKQFMSIFDGKIIIFQENKTTNELELAKLENYMLQVKYYGHFNIKAIQVDFKPASLNSYNVFIVCSNSNFYVWCGKASTGDERQTAKSIITNLKKEPEIIIESQEKEAFWQALGGKQPYFTEKRIPAFSQSAQIVRLFEVLNENGKVFVQEIFDFAQEDLNINEIMILDIWESIFIWIGSGSNKKDVDELDKIIKEYLKNDPCQRQIDTPIFRIRQGTEPAYFIGFFGSGWNDFETVLSYNDLKFELQSKNQQHLFELANLSLKTNENKKNIVIDFSKYPKYSYDELIKPADELPENVNTTIKEVYLKESDFQKIFNMTFDEFCQKPIWKQKELKRSAHLF